jgi:hypothetical protein
VPAVHDQLEEAEARADAALLHIAETQRELERRYDPELVAEVERLTTLRRELLAIRGEVAQLSQGR